MVNTALLLVQVQGVIWMLTVFAIVSPHHIVKGERSFFKLLVIAWAVSSLANVSNWLYDPRFLNTLSPDALTRWIGLRVLAIGSGLLALIWAIWYGRRGAPDVAPTADHTGG